jgi:serine/threonine protein kinase
MPNLDAAALAKLAVQLRLVTQDQVDECRQENNGSDGQVLLRAFERKGYLTPFQTHKLQKGDQDGYFLGGYRLLYKIASGSFGRVFRADDPHTHTIVAVKVLRRRWTSNTHSVELFEREAKLGMSLRHPNIVSILSMSKDAPSNQYYIVMEFVEGGNLRDFMGIRKKLEPQEALRVIEDATAGLAYAFSRGVTHRDMKLTNILISAQGVAKLVDFGLASFGSSEEGEGNQVDRSVDYAGLEKASNVRPGDVRSDIYFLGCVLYEMLTGKSPLVMTKDKHIRQAKERFLKVPPMSGAEVSAPKQVFDLVETMMSLEPQRRYQTPSQLLEAVRAARQAVEGKSNGPRKAADEIKRSTRSESSGDTIRRSSRDELVGEPPVPEQDGQAAAEPPAADGESTPGKPALCLLEAHEKIQNVIRDKFVELGFDVHLESEPAAVSERYKQTPYDALVVDAGPTGKDAVVHFVQVMTEARKQQHGCVGILLLAENQAGWAERLGNSKYAAVMVRPVTLKQLADKLTELTAVAKNEVK